MIQVRQEDSLMLDRYLLSEAQLERIKPYFPYPMADRVSATVA
jgi:hypothetical protein